MPVTTWRIIECGDEIILALNADGNDAARVPRSELNALCAHLISLQICQPPLDFEALKHERAFGESLDD